jgi:hypothetical protein
MFALLRDMFNRERYENDREYMIVLMAAARALRQW